MSDWPKAKPSFADAILSLPGIQSYWRLGEASGTAIADLGPAGVAGTRTGGSLGAGSLLTGDADTGWTAGSTDFIDFGSVFPFNGGSAFSVGFLVKPTSLPGSAAAMLGAWDDAVGSGWIVSLFPGAPEARLFRFNAGSGQVATTPNCLFVGERTLVLATYDGANMIVTGWPLDRDIAVPSVLAASAVAMPATPPSLRLGKNQSLAGMPGTYDEVFVCNQKVSQAKLAMIAGLAV